MTVACYPAPEGTRDSGFRFPREAGMTAPVDLLEIPGDEHVRVRNGVSCWLMSRQTELNGLQRVLVEERHRLLRFLRLRGAGDDAEDILHDLWQRIAAVRAPVAQPLPYLFRVAENLMRDRRRSELSREKRERDWTESVSPEFEVPPGDEAIIARQHLDATEEAIARLGPRASEVFRRARLEGEGQAMIARDLGVSLSSVEKDLQRAYRVLGQLKVRFNAE